jgi:hypothetical protein
VRLKFLDPEYSGEEKFVSRTIPSQVLGIGEFNAFRVFGSPEVQTRDSNVNEERLSGTGYFIKI